MDDVGGGENYNSILCNYNDISDNAINDILLWNLTLNFLWDSAMCENIFPSPADCCVTNNDLNLALPNGTFSYSGFNHWGWVSTGSVSRNFRYFIILLCRSVGWPRNCLLISCEHNEPRESSSKWSAHAI